MTNESVLLQDLRGGMCSSGLCSQLRSVAADEIERLTRERDAAYASQRMAAEVFDKHRKSPPYAHETLCELPEGLRDPIKVMERVRELKGAGPVPAHEPRDGLYLKALQKIILLSHEFNSERNAYASKLEQIAHDAVSAVKSDDGPHCTACGRGHGLHHDMCPAQPL